MGEKRTRLVIIIGLGRVPIMLIDINRKLLLGFVRVLIFDILSFKHSLAAESGKMIIISMAMLITVGFASHAPIESQTAVSQSKPMICDTGPIKRTFGGWEWKVYSCEDLASMVVVSAQNNPASPFYFFLTRTQDGYRITGEGNGDQKVSKAAADDLKKMTLSEWDELLTKTKSAQ